MLSILLSDITNEKLAFFFLKKKYNTNYYLYIYFQNIPYFGQYQKQRWDIISKMKEDININNELDVSVPCRTINKLPREIPSVNSVIGKSLPFIGPYKQLNNKDQVVALIDDVSKFIIYL